MMAVPAWAASKVFVSDVSPDGGATSIAADSTITAKFSKAMKARTIKGSTFYLTKQDPSTAIPAKVSYSGTSKTATLDPDSNLEAGATYTATIKGGKRGVRASNGDKLGGTRDSTATFANGKVTWAFTVSNDPPPSDTLPPTVSSVTPTNGATKVAINTKVTATFSEEMDSSTVTNQSFTLSKSGSPVSAQVTYDPNSLTATLDPDQNLENGTTYDAKITTSTKDLAGNAITQQKSWSFTTSDPGVAFTPDPLSFTSDVLCFPESKSLTVNNNGPGDVTFANVSITGPDAARFSTGSQRFLANNGPFTVLAGNFFQDQVTFSPTGGPPQPRTYSATLTYKDGTGATIGSPVTLSARTTCLVFG
jgi:hypothetical protein